MSSIIGLLIAFMIGITLLTAIGFIIYIIIRSSYKKKLNKRLQEDNALIADGKMPEPNRNHLSEPSVWAPLYILFCCLICLLTIQFVSLSISIQALGDKQNAEVQALAELYDQMLLFQSQIEDLNSAIADIDTDPDWKNLNETTYCVPVSVTIRLKKWTADTQLSLIVNGKSYPAAQANGVFTLVVPITIFPSGSETLIACLETDGTYESYDLDYYAHFGYIDRYYAFGYSGQTFDGGFRIDYNPIKKQFETNPEFERMVLHYKESLFAGPLTKATLSFLVDDEVVSSFDLDCSTNRWTFEKDEIAPIKGSKDSEVIMQEVYTTARGYSIIIRERLTDESPWNTDFYIYAPNGTVVYSEEQH